MKPIVKIETPSILSNDDLEGIINSLKGAPIAEDYHILVIRGSTDYFSVEIITASDIRLHEHNVPPVVDWKDIAHNHGTLV